MVKLWTIPALASLAIGMSAHAEAPKNWTPPATRIYAQSLSDDIMKHHPELWSVTFHGVPPGMDKVYTMFAGSYPDRIGNPDDPDDIDVIEKGISSVDPRWHRHDAFAKFVLQIPLRDRAGENVGLLVLAYKTGPGMHMSERDYFNAGTLLRDQLEDKIPSYAELFEPAK
ncbi:MAG: hypothetical protein KGQ42_07380 [Alphaproteobacteria bacterium]|nr:hypothetical protein [Alphaproteobacteria bacterium]MDE2043399.1 hypothetical protein [Alphaproteobacteria bacterium]MDE2339898.1 hypothetical protein [Alphaproteobacteria bacterium]